MVTGYAVRGLLFLSSSFFPKRVLIAGAEASNGLNKSLKGGSVPERLVSDGYS